MLVINVMMLLVNCFLYERDFLKCVKFVNFKMFDLSVLEIFELKKKIRRRIRLFLLLVMSGFVVRILRR